ncbi:MAG: response regulator transcription factor [Acidobacteria bacterium]|nr:response regulator transcription factor [Acidobacteriota bacterium]
MRSVVIDDEPAARSRLIRLLRAHPQVSVIGEARDGPEALTWIEEHQPDLIFLDIEMPGLNGFQVLRSLSPDVEMPLVVFVTGYDEHALAAFEANAVAYLLKPVEPERLAMVIARAQQITRGSSRQMQERRLVERAAKTAPITLRQVVARKRDARILISPDTVLYFVAEDGVVKAHTATDALLVNYQLGELEEGLPKEQFFRANRSTIVNLHQVTQIRPYFKSSFLLVLNDTASTEITVSTRQSKLLRERIPGL